MTDERSAALMALLVQCGCTGASAMELAQVAASILVTTEHAALVETLRTRGLAHDAVALLEILSARLSGESQAALARAIHDEACRTLAALGLAPSDADRIQRALRTETSGTAA